MCQPLVDELRGQWGDLKTRPLWGRKRLRVAPRGPRGEELQLAGGNGARRRAEVQRETLGTRSERGQQDAAGGDSGEWGGLQG